MQWNKHEKQITAALLFTGVFLLFLAAGCNTGKNAGKKETGLDSLSFIVLGDWGRDGTGHQKAVAEQMDTVSRRFGAQFIITTGDNFYDEGVASTTDVQWKTSFETIYNKKGHWVTWYPSLGNHDYGLNPQAQVEYSSVSSRWTMPGRHYTVKKKFAEDQTALFVFTDTSPFVTAYHNRGMSDLGRQDTAAQLRWLQKNLDSDKHTWKIAIGHHPLYSSGPHGNTNELIQRFQPIFSKTGTDFYLCGHDHTLEHVVQPGEKTNYLVSGGGGAGLYKIKQIPNSRFSMSSAGFLVMTLYGDKANLYFYNEKGDLLYQQQVVK